MNKQHNDQDDKQTPTGETRDGTVASSSAQATESGKKDGSQTRRSRRHNKPAQRDAKDDTQASSAAASAPAAEGKPAGDTQPAKSAAKSGTKPAASTAKSTTAAPEKARPAPAAPSAGSGSASGGGASGGGGSVSSQPSGGSKTGAAALVLAILVGAGGGYFGWQLWQKLEAQEQAIAALPDAPVSQSALDSLESQVNSQLQSGEQQRNQAMDSAIDELRSEFSDYRSSVDGTLDKVLTQLSQEQDTDEREWLHAEAAYLLRLANQRLQLERDVGGAAALLRTADERLVEADNPALTPVRRELASELAAIESVPRVDRTGLYLSLNAQQERVNTLPLSQDIEEMVADAQIEEAPTGGWKSQLSTFGNELKGLVTVRKHDEALEALISPEQESYLRQSLRLVLEQSQLALLKEEQELYDASLDKALTLIRGYYDTSDSGVQAVMESLQQLQEKTIHPELPDISGSQQALNRFIKKRFESSSQGDNA